MNEHPDDPAKDLLDRLGTWINIGTAVAGFILIVTGIVVSHPPMIGLGGLAFLTVLLKAWMRRSPSDKGAKLKAHEPAAAWEVEAGASTGTGQITVRRRKGTAIIGGQYEVFVDGQPVGSLNSGDEVTLDVPSGEHDVQVRTKNYSSASLLTRVAPDTSATIEVWGSMLRIRYAAHDPERAIAIRRAT